MIHVAQECGGYLYTLTYLLAVQNLLVRVLRIPSYTILRLTEGVNSKAAIARSRINGPIETFVLLPI